MGNICKTTKKEPFQCILCIKLDNYIVLNDNLIWVDSCSIATLGLQKRSKKTNIIIYNIFDENIEIIEIENKIYNNLSYDSNNNLFAAIYQTKIYCWNRSGELLFKKELWNDIFYLTWIDLWDMWCISILAPDDFSKLEVYSIDKKGEEKTYKFIVYQDKNWNSSSIESIITNKFDKIIISYHINHFFEKEFSKESLLFICDKYGNNSLKLTGRSIGKICFSELSNKLIHLDNLNENYSRLLIPYNTISENEIIWKLDKISNISINSNDLMAISFKEKDTKNFGIKIYYLGQNKFKYPAISNKLLIIK